MNANEITAEIERQIRKLMTELTADITPSSVFEELGMDSLNRVDLLAAAEMVFGIEVPDDEVEKLVRVQDLTDLVLSSREAA